MKKLGGRFAEGKDGDGAGSRAERRATSKTETHFHDLRSGRVWNAHRVDLMISRAGSAFTKYSEARASTHTATAPIAPPETLKHAVSTWPHVEKHNELASLDTESHQAAAKRRHNARGMP